MIDRKLILLPVLLGMTTLAGCNTIGGFGQDVEETGAAVQDTAQDTEAEMED